jgi:hypothetical protein
VQGTDISLSLMFRQDDSQQALHHVPSASLMSANDRR